MANPDRGGIVCPIQSGRSLHICMEKGIDRVGQISGGRNTINLLGRLNDSMDNPYSFN